jgi:DNA/RNA-binding domain of Phe-tRNA-synthetase-like protein
MKLNIHESIKQITPNFSLGYVVIRNITVQGTPPSLAQEIFHLQAEAARHYHIETLLDSSHVVGVRSVYKKNHFNPSRYNKSSEELVRRVLQRKDVYYVNSAVAINNYCSVKFLLPFGSYDLDQIDGDITYQLHSNSTGNDVSTGSKPFLTDAKGAFGSSISNARRTAVTLATRSILVVVYADGEAAVEELTDMLDFIGEMIVCYNGGEVDTQGIIKA